MPSNDVCQPCCVTGLGEGLGEPLAAVLGEALDAVALGEALDAVELIEATTAGTAGEAADDPPTFAGESACARAVKSIAVSMAMAQAAMNGGLTVELPYSIKAALSHLHAAFRLVRLIKEERFVRRSPRVQICGKGVNPWRARIQEHVDRIDGSLKDAGKTSHKMELHHDTSVSPYLKLHDPLTTADAVVQCGPDYVSQKSMTTAVHGLHHPLSHWDKIKEPPVAPRFRR